MLLHSVIIYEQGDRPPATGGPPPMLTPDVQIAIAPLDPGHIDYLGT